MFYRSASILKNRRAVFNIKGKETFWMGLQTDYDMAKARAALRDTLDHIRMFEPARA